MIEILKTIAWYLVCMTAFAGAMCIRGLVFGVFKNDRDEFDYNVFFKWMIFAYILSFLMLLVGDLFLS